MRDVCSQSSPEGVASCDDSKLEVQCFNNRLHFSQVDLHPTNFLLGEIFEPVKDPSWLAANQISLLAVQVFNGIKEGEIAS